MKHQRRQKGEGSIIEYKKGHYRGFLDLGRDPQTQKRIRKTFTGTDKREVIKLMQQYQYEKEKGILSINSMTPFNIYCNHFLEIKEGKVKSTTYKSYVHYINKHFIPFFHQTPLKDIKTKDINTFLIQHKNYSGATTNIYRTVLSMIFQTAIAEELIFTNPVSLSENIKTRQKEIVPLTIDEAQLLLNSVKDMKVHTGIPWYPIILLCLECGFRRGEVLGLHWSDIDTANNTITIHRSIASDTSIQTPKTQKAQRTIAVDAKTIKILLTYKKHDIVVFPNAIGSYFAPTAVSVAFKHLSESLGLHIRFHDLRHTNATWLIAKGVNPKTVSARLGHSDVSITLNRYTHAVQEEDKKAASLINNLINKK